MGNDIQNIKSNPFDLTRSYEKFYEYWVSPFNKWIDLSEEEFLYNIKAIVIEGPIGCGKTTLLKYYSYEWQRNIKTLQSNKDFLGMYLEYDKEILHVIDKICDWNEYVGYDCINEYFNINMLIKIIDIIIDLYKNDEIIEQNIINIFEGMATSETISIKSLNELEDVQKNIKLEFLDNISKFKNDHFFNFKTTNVNIEKLINTLKKTIVCFKNTRFILLLDNYEKYSIYGQKYINLMMKYINNQSAYTIRVVKANNNFKTYDTINQNEYLRSGSDYKEAHFDSLLKMKEFKLYLNEVCDKYFKVSGREQLVISDILSYREDFINESLEIVCGRKKHFRLLINATNNDIKKINYPKNPLIEMMNILYVIRLKNLKSTEIKDEYQIVKNMMMSFLNKEYDETYKKYKNDYMNKYRLSLLILLCKIYKVEKKYYSFNTLSYLVSGNVRLFIEVLAEIWNEAMKNDWNGIDVINSSIQSEVVYRILNTEVEKIKYEKPEMYRMLDILGKKFQEYHYDNKVKYPETNQFSLYGKMSKRFKGILDEAILNGIIFKKNRLQQKSIGLDKGEIYVLNRKFAVTYQLSYRIRGGYIVRYECNKLEADIMNESKLESSENVDTNKYNQLSLFDKIY